MRKFRPSLVDIIAYSLATLLLILLTIITGWPEIIFLLLPIALAFSGAATGHLIGLQLSKIEAFKKYNRWKRAGNSIGLFLFLILPLCPIMIYSEDKWSNEFLSLVHLHLIFAVLASTLTAVFWKPES